MLLQSHNYSDLLKIFHSIWFSHLLHQGMCGLKEEDGSQPVALQGAAISVMLHTPSSSKKPSQVLHKYILFTGFCTSQVL